MLRKRLLTLKLKQFGQRFDVPGVVNGDGTEGHKKLSRSSQVIGGAQHVFTVPKRCEVGTSEIRYPKAIVCYCQIITCFGD